MSVYLSAKHRFFFKKKLCKIPCSYELASCFFPPFILCYHITLLSIHTDRVRDAGSTSIPLFIRYISLAAANALLLLCCSKSRDNILPLVALFCPYLTKPKRKGKYTLQLWMLYINPQQGQHYYSSTVLLLAAGWRQPPIGGRLIMHACHA